MGAMKLAEINKPDYTHLWSSGGAIVAPSNVKIQTGWTAEVPPFQWENWSQNRQDAAISHILQKGISVWSATGEYYFTTSGERSYVQGSDGNIYIAVADSVGQDPVTDVSDTYWVLVATFPLATTAQSQAWSNNTSLLSPLRLSEAFKGTNQSLTGNGYQKFPGGLIIQWLVGTIPAATGLNFTWPIAFPSAVVNAQLSVIGPVSSQEYFTTVTTLGGGADLSSASDSATTFIFGVGY